MSQSIVSNFPLRGSIAQMIGGRQEQQDAVGYSDAPIGCIVVVCDGVGGQEGGSTASWTAVQTIIDDVSLAKYYDDPQEVLYNAIIHANQEILRKSAEDPSLAHMATTVTAMILNKQCATIAHVGDSRIYQLRGRKKVYRTSDHSLVFEMVRQHKLTEEQARTSPQSNIILRALGSEDTAEPEIYSLPYNKGDRFLLCTDGFWGAMPEKDFLKHVTARGKLDDIAENTAHVVNNIGVSTGGGHDNLTAAIVVTTKNSKLKRKMRTIEKVMWVVIGCLLALSLCANAILMVGLHKATPEKNVFKAATEWLMPKDADNNNGADATETNQSEQSEKSENSENSENSDNSENAKNTDATIGA